MLAVNSWSSRFEEGEFRKRIQFMYGGKIQKVRFRYKGPDIDSILDRLPTAHVLDEENGEYIVAAEVFGTGINMWIRSQDNFLFRCSLLENIRLGNPAASDEEVREAAGKACCEEFIEKLPMGYDTPAGEAGKRLSGGEKQRIAIAHRLTTIEQADQILVVDDGQIVQKGTHRELASVPGKYQDFVEIRSQSEGWKIG